MSAFPNRESAKDDKSHPPSPPKTPGTPSRTAPINTKLLAASICSHPARLVHIPELGLSNIRCSRQKNTIGLFLLKILDLKIIAALISTPLVKLLPFFLTTETSELGLLVVTVWQARSREGLREEWHSDSAHNHRFLSADLKLTTRLSMWH